MRIQNCQRLSPLISLYVAGDLPDASQREATAHLAICEACRQLAEEFSASTSLLVQACPPPEFDAEFYAGIRNAVLGEISSNRRLPKAWFFQRPWVYATSFAAVAIAALLLVQYFGSKRPTTNNVAGKKLVQSTPEAIAAASPAISAPQAPRKSEDPPAAPGVHDNLSYVLPRKSSKEFKTRGNRFEPLATAQSDLNLSAQLAPAKEFLTAVQSPPAETLTAASLASAGTAQVSRIEIQTSDPNIRIIWLTASEPSPSENTNQDQDKHGDRK
jgi:hypothetical protein